MGIFCRFAAEQIGRLAAGHAKVLRVNGKGSKSAVLHLAGDGLAGQGDFIQTVAAADDNRTLDTQICQYLSNRLNQIFVVYADQVQGCRRRTGQRTEHIKQGAGAHLAANRSGIFHGRMIELGKHETDADLVEHLCALHRRELNVDAKRL